jgi:hypothetical protein
MEAVCSSETLLSTYNFTRRYNPEDQRRHNTFILISPFSNTILRNILKSTDPLYFGITTLTLFMKIDKIRAEPITDRTHWRHDVIVPTFALSLQFFFLMSVIDVWFLTGVDRWAWGPQGFILIRALEVR